MLTRLHSNPLSVFTAAKKGMTGYDAVYLALAGELDSTWLTLQLVINKTVAILL